jgi:SAM-dependent methyltransferase
MAESKAEKLAKILRPGAPKSTPGSSGFPGRSTSPGLLGRVQHWLKAKPELYDALVSILSPVRASPQFNRELDRLLVTHGQQSVVLNLGSGPGYFRGRGDFINVDLFALPRVDIQADARDVPVESDCADLVLNIAMLEHVPAPETVVAEMLRVLKPGGTAFAYLPFMQPFHGAPSDFHRWTIEGARILFSNFSTVRVGLGAGPASGMLWLGLEWFSLFLSFGNRTLKDLIFLATMPLVAPFKHLDLLLCSHPCAQVMASGFYVVATK